MKITMLGTGTSMPDSERVQSGILIETNGGAILADIGSGVLHRLTQTGFDFNSLDAVFISHFHVDHCSDFVTLCQTLWLSGYGRTLELYGPPMVEDWLSTLQESVFPYISEKLEINVNVLNPDEQVSLGDLHVSNMPTVHGTMETRALKFQRDDTIVVFSSDTAPNRNMIAFSKKADILIHECNWLDGDHPEGVHTSPSELASIASEAEPRMVVLNHVSPEVVRQKRDTLRIVASETDAKVIMAEDLMKLNQI
jgi:ribonuclease BN (tRNA processing enzyme)